MVMAMKTYAMEYMIIRKEEGFWKIEGEDINGNKINKNYFALSFGLPEIEVKRSGNLWGVYLKDKEGMPHRIFIARKVILE